MTGDKVRCAECVYYGENTKSGLDECPTRDSDGCSHPDESSTDYFILYTRSKDEADAKELSDGCKYDHGKVDMSFLEYFPLALKAVCEVSQFGGDKGYVRGSFTDVPNARKRYTAAMLRHYFAEGCIEEDTKIDPESGLPHDYAVAWNALCRLELRLRNQL